MLGEVTSAHILGVGDHLENLGVDIKMDIKGIR
jgi:hypothetical protein